MAEFAGSETDSGRKLVSVHGHCSQVSTATIHRKMYLCSLVLETTLVCAQSTLHYPRLRGPDQDCRDKYKDLR